MKHKDPSVPNILYQLADVLGTAVNERKLVIPVKAGSGYCSGFVFNHDIRMLICNYELNEDLLVDNPDIGTFKRMLFFKFQNIFPKEKPLLNENIEVVKPSVLIATSRINTDGIIAIHSNTSTINIEVDADYLKRQFDSAQISPVLYGLLQNTQPLLFDQLVYPSLFKIVNEIIDESTNNAPSLFFIRVKAEELICKLLMELEKRDEKQLYTLNTHDIQTLYKVKDQILKHLETPPVIKDLVILAGMSPTKLKRLFRQIFGNSIFNYYQQFRMQEGARLLKEEGLSVSEVGYRLGFTNLSHFTRVFQEHIGMKPKQYSLK
ncbi:MAG: AraC family transcriptional regulator [Ferruginibacter sp.]